MAFYVGQKVVCVDASDLDHVFLHPLGFRGTGDLDGLTEGYVYTVRSVLIGYGDIPCLRLREIKRGIDPVYGREAAYAACRFRPVVERKTDISIFKAMLNPKTAEIDA